MLPGTYNNVVAIGGRTIEVVDSVEASPAAGTEHTFSGVTFGPSYGSRVLVACIALRSSAGVVLNQTACTIGGVSAGGDDTGGFDAGGPSMGVGVWAAAVPSGASGDVFIDWGVNNVGSASLVLLSVPRISLPLFNTDDDFATSGLSVNGTVNIPAGGTLIVAAAHTNLNNTTMVGVTEQFEMNVGSGRLAVGFDERMGVETGRAVSASWSGNAPAGMKASSYSV